MATQTVIWTVLPNSIATGRLGVAYAQFSVFVSFRLKASTAEGDTLSLYPDVRHWTNTLRKIRSFRLEFGGTTTARRAYLLDFPGKNWWEGLFKDDTYVRPYEFPDLTDRLIISYPVSNIVGFIKQLYQKVGLNSPNQLPGLYNRETGLSAGAALLNSNGFPWNKDMALGVRERLAAEFFQSGGEFTGNPLLSEYDHVLAYQTVASDPSGDLQRLLLFHYPPEKLHTTEAEDEAAVTKELPPLPKTAADFERYMDFHEVVSSLGDYPVLMRELGLVLDFVVPVAAIPSNAQTMRITPQWRSNAGVNIISESPYTAFSLNSPHGIFRARSRGTSTPRIQDDQLLLEPPGGNFDLVEIDVDGAALKLVGMANGIASTGRLLAADTPHEGGLPTIRTGGLSLVLSERAAHTRTHLQKTLADDQVPDKNTLVLYAEDVLRGYRVDVWDTLTGAWHSLCQRVGDYTIEGTELHLANVIDEGFAQMAMTQQAPTEEGAPPASDDLYLHESIFRWDGWSLVAPRPGKTIGEQGDTNGPLTDPQPQPMMPFKLVTQFKAAPRSLPRLRFGAGYRMRVRIADLAGNSVPLEDAGSARAIPAPVLPPRNYLRFEPVGSPSVYLREAITADDAGESLARLVIRSYNAAPDQDALTTSELAQRHIAPPPTGEQIAEAHGVLDDPAGRLRNDAATYTLLDNRSQPVDTSTTDSPVIADAQMQILYLPDPLAVGAALRDLPGTPDGTIGTVDSTGALAYTPVEGVEVRPGSVVHVGYRPSTSVDPLTDLLDELPFRLLLVEHTSGTFVPPDWDDTQRTLTLYVPKAEEISFPLSSYLYPEELKLMGVWEWIREFIDTSIQGNLSNPDALELLTHRVVNCVQYALEGGHWMLTPARKITLVHAVQQPLGLPNILVLAATRSDGDTDARFVGIIKVHGKSTLTVNLMAQWDEPIDDVSKPGPESRSSQQQVEEIAIKSLEGGALPGSKNDKNGLPTTFGIYLPENDWLEFGAAGSLIASPIHEFGDTKHRMIQYNVIAGTRFREYFPNDVPGGFTRPSNAVTVSVPSSERPVAPAVRYVIPTYGWKREVTTNLIGSYRQGGGLRIYLERPWYSSGEGELLGVVMWKGYSLDNDQRHQLARYITQWGMDPIWDAQPTSDLPNANYFKGETTSSTTVVLPELAHTGVDAGDNTVSVVGYLVQYDETRGLWYCDIEIDTYNTYYPFVRLALVRYQPRSIAGKHLSRVTLADFAQLAPDRSAVLTYDPYDADMLNFVVSGYTYSASANASGAVVPDSSTFVVRVEQRNPDLTDDLAWTTATNVTVTPEQTSQPLRVLWKGQIKLPADRQPGQYRVVVEEYERVLRRVEVPNIRLVSTRGIQVVTRASSSALRVSEVSDAARGSLLARRILRRTIYTRSARLIYADIIVL